MTPLPIDINFDVSGTFPSGEQLTQSAWVFLPPSPTKARAVLLCLAGGTYDKSYWHLVVPGFPRYSFAEHMSGMGFVVVALDHLGVGGSSDPKDNGDVGLELMARGDAAVAAQVAAMVRNGTLTDALPLLSDVPMVGVGHSMGACLTTMVQAEDRIFSAIALLGYSVNITNVHANQPTDADLNAAIAETEVIVRQNSEALQDGTSTIVPREPLHGLFHAPDVPPLVIAADDAVQSRVPIRAVAQVTTPGFVGRYASKVDVPVLLAFGDVDVAPDPRIEAAYFPACRDITLVVVEGSAHCHNFSSGRIALWERLGAWLETV